MIIGCRDSGSGYQVDRYDKKISVLNYDHLICLHTNFKTYTTQPYRCESERITSNLQTDKTTDTREQFTTCTKNVKNAPTLR